MLAMGVLPPTTETIRERDRVRNGQTICIIMKYMKIQHDSIPGGEQLSFISCRRNMGTELRGFMSVLLLHLTRKRRVSPSAKAFFRMSCLACSLEIRLLPSRYSRNF